MAIPIDKNEKVVGVLPSHARLRAKMINCDDDSTVLAPIIAIVLLQDMERHSIRAQLITDLGIHGYENNRTHVPESVVYLRDGNSISPDIEGRLNDIACELNSLNDTFKSLCAVIKLDKKSP